MGFRVGFLTTDLTFAQFRVGFLKTSAIIKKNGTHPTLQQININPDQTMDNINSNKVDPNNNSDTNKNTDPNSHLNKNTVIQTKQ